MKRLVWVLLAAWCTAFAQVQPLPAAPNEPSDCCGRDCACGMPECVALPAMPAQPAALQRAQSVARPELRRDAPATAALVAKFFAAFEAPAIELGPCPIATAESPPAGVPLFKEHCVFLI